MKPISKREINSYVKSNIVHYHRKRIEYIDNIDLLKLIKCKNIALYKANGCNTSEQIVRKFVDAHLSSKEETIFGQWLESFAIFVNGKVYGGRKSNLCGIDLEFTNKNTKYFVSIKSGPKWANRDSGKQMLTNFEEAKSSFESKNKKIKVVCVNGCCYGKDDKPEKKDGKWIKLCGQRFWHFISGDNNFYTEFISPLSHTSKEKNNKFEEGYCRMINKFTKEFSNKYCDIYGEINWNKIMEINSGANYDKCSSLII